MLKPNPKTSWNSVERMPSSTIIPERRIFVAHGAIIHGQLRSKTNAFWASIPKVHASNLGKGCFMGHRAIVMGVNLADSRFVPHGA